MSPPITPKRIMINTAAVLLVIGLAWLLIQIRSIIVLVVLGILLAAAIEPIVFRLRRRGLSRGQSVIAVYAGLIAVIGVVAYLVVPPLVAQGTDLVDNVPTILLDLRDTAAQSDSNFIRTSGVRIIDRGRSEWDSFRASPNIEGTQAVSFVTSVVGFLFTTITTMIVAFYWMTEKTLIKRLILGLFPLERRDRAHALWDEVESRLGGWTRGQLTLCLVIGLVSAVGFRIIGLNFWLALGILAGITEIIPFIGPIIGGAAAVLVAMTDSWQKAAIVLVFAFLVQQLESAFLVPRVMRNAVGMTPLTVILAVLIGGTIAGPIGSILAIPIGAAVQVFVQDLLRNREDDPDSLSSDGHAAEINQLAFSQGRKRPRVGGRRSRSER